MLKKIFLKRHGHTSVPKSPTRAKNNLGLNNIPFLKRPPKMRALRPCSPKKKWLVNTWTEGADWVETGAKMEAKSRNTEFCGGVRGRGWRGHGRLSHEWAHPWIYSPCVGQGPLLVFQLRRIELQFNPTLLIQLCSLFLLPLSPLWPPFLLFPSLSLSAPQPSLCPPPSSLRQPPGDPAIQ